ncbi:MAG: Dabb family protein [Lachnospiraceae bacterium]|nr:Dabb family protein [Lachnospiraceae bacterium]
MVKHVVLWKLKEDLTLEEKEQAKKGIKEGLEGLMGKIPGLLEAKVQTLGLSSSNVDVMIESLFESEEALQGYAKHPAHVEVATTKVRPFTAARTCMDYVVR